MGNTVYPTLPGISDVVKRPCFSTLAQEAMSGKKKKIGNWIYPRWEIDLQYDTLLDKSSSEFKTLVGFFLARRGKLDSFLFDDPDDNFTTGQQIGEGDGETKIFQLLRSFGGFLEPCLNPKSDPAPKIYLDDVLQESGYAIGYTDSGVVTFTAAPGNEVVITAEFGYYWRCCFTADLYEFEKYQYKLWKGKISLETVK